MKKLLIVLLVLLVSVTGLFALNQHSSISLGVSFFTVSETVSFQGASVSGNERSLGMSLNVNNAFFPNNSKFGFNLGTNILFPISASVNGTSVQTGFFNVNYIFKPGVAFRYNINDRFRSITNAGYELQMNFSSQYSDQIKINTSTFIHGIYIEENLSYAFNKTVGLNLGLELTIPLANNIIMSANGTSITTNTTYAGVIINPSVGVSISR